MSPYRASGGSGLFGSYTYPQRPMIDLGDAFQGVGNGVASVIQSIYQRRANERREQLERDRLALEQEREARAQANADRDYDLRKETARRNFIAQGGIPESETFDTTPSSIDFSREFNPSTIAPAPTGVASTPIGRAILAGVQQSVAPQQPAQQAPTPESRLHVTPESFDPTRASTYVRQYDVQSMKNAFQADEQGKRLAAAQRGREYAAMAARLFYDYKRAHPMPKSLVGRAMTAGQEHNMRVAIAAGFLTQHGGYSQDALDTFRNSPEGRALAAQGITETDLLEGSTKIKRDPVTGQILGLINAGAADDAGGAARQVQAADSAARAMRFPPKTSTAPAWPGFTLQSPFANAPGGGAQATGAPETGAPAQPANSAPPAVAPKGGGSLQSRRVRDDRQPSPIAPPPTKPPAAVAPPSTAPDDFSDDEIAAALKAGKSSPDDVRAYVLAQRKRGGGP